MRITIFGATGGIGRHLVEQAVAAGHDVTAVARTPKGFAERVRSVTADLTAVQSDVLMEAIRGADVVMSALGMRSKADQGIAARGTDAIVAAMKVGGPRRLVVVSAGPIGTFPSRKRPDPPPDPGDTFVSRFVVLPILKRVFRKSYVDLVEMEDHVRESGLDWTIVRPPRLLDGAGRGLYRTAIDMNVRGGSSITRSDVAHLMLAIAERPDTIGHTVSIAY